MEDLKKQEYINTLRKLEQSSADKIGTLGKIGVSATGAGVGAMGAGSIASLFGATTILGSSTLASIVGGVLVTTTPIGWVLGSAAVGTVAAYSISKLVSSGAANDERKKSTIMELKKEIAKYEQASAKILSSEKIGKVAGAYALLLEHDLIEQTKVEAILSNVKDGVLDADYALTMAQNILDEVKDAIEKGLKPNSEDSIVRASFINLYKYIMIIDGSVKESELSLYFKVMKNNFQCSEEFAQKLLNESPLIMDEDEILKDIKKIIPENKYELLVDSLIAIAYSDGEYHSKEKVFIEKIKQILKK